MNPQHPNFVPADAVGTRSETAALLVGTAREFGISQHSIKRAGNGYYITNELADILEAEYAEDEVQEETEVETEVSGNESSGNRASKKKQKKGK